MTVSGNVEMPRTVVRIRRNQPIGRNLLDNLERAPGTDQQKVDEAAADAASLGLASEATPAATPPKPSSE